MLIARYLALALVAGLFVLAAPVTAAPTPAMGPSFDCSKPSEIEAVIRHDAELSAADRRLTTLYDAAEPGALGTGSSQLHRQRRWLKGLHKDCANGAWQTSIRSKSLRDCITFYYDGRLKELAISALFVSPQKSLSELRRIDPKAAPMYEAVFDYATIDNKALRVRAVEALLAPIHSEMEAGPHDDFKTWYVDPIPPHVAAKSDDVFAHFFDIFARSADLTWPCAALVKRPGLVDGLGAFWGGAADGMIPGSDCDASLPPLPAVETLILAAMKVQPVCDGTIRFTTGRDYFKLLDAVRLHRPEVWAAKAFTYISKDSSPEKRTFRRKYRIEIATAEAVLAQYYVANFKTPPDKAQRDAKTGVEALVSGAFGLCE